LELHLCTDDTLKGISACEPQIPSPSDILHGKCKRKIGFVYIVSQTTCRAYKKTQHKKQTEAEERNQVLLGKDHFCLQVWDMLFEIFSLLSEDRCALMKKIEINRITLIYKKGDIGYLCTGEKEG
jgi:hypothetical protein